MIHSRTSALALRCAPLPLVRIGFVGLGRRGLATLRRYQYIKGVEVTALADLSETCVASAKSVLQGWHKYEEVGESSESWAHCSAEKLQCYVGKDAASRLIHSGEVDVVSLCTDWASHTPLASCCYLRGGMLDVGAHGRRNAATLLHDGELLL